MPYGRSRSWSSSGWRSASVFVMLIANQSVTGKVATTLSSIGNTVTIGLPGNPAGGQPGKKLTTAELAPIAHLHGVTSIDETLHGAAEPRGRAPTAHTSLRPANVSPAVYFSGSTQPANPVNIGASALRIVSGHAISGTSPARRRHGQHGDGAEERAQGRLGLHRLRQDAHRRGALRQRQPAGQRHGHHLAARPAAPDGRGRPGQHRRRHRRLARRARRDDLGDRARARPRGERDEQPGRRQPGDRRPRHA